MQQIKIFKAVEAEITTLEAEVNAWLAESGVNVVNVFGNIAPQSKPDGGKAGLGGSRFDPSDVLLVVVYEK